MNQDDSLPKNLRQAVRYADVLTQIVERMKTWCLSRDKQHWQMRVCLLVRKLGS